MTLENSKRLYKHFISKGMKKEAEDIARKYPEVAKEEKVIEKPKEKKKKKVY